MWCVPAAPGLYGVTCHADWNDICGLQDLVEFLHGALHLPSSYLVHFCLEWCQLLLRGFCTQICPDCWSSQKAREQKAVILWVLGDSSQAQQPKMFSPCLPVLSVNNIGVS